MRNYDRYAKLTFLVVIFLLAFSLGISGQSPNLTSGRVAYLHNDSVWIKALPGGEPLQVLATTATDLKWSPSGSWLALRAKDKTIVISADGRRQFVIQTDTSAWSPVNDELAFKAVDGVHVDRLDSVGPHARVIMRRPNVGSFAWSQDGTHLAVTVLEDRSAHLWIANDDASPAHEIVVDRSERAPNIIQKIIPVKGQLRMQSPRLDLGEATFAGWTGDDRWILLWPNAAHSASLAADGLDLVAVPSRGGVVRSVSDLLKIILRDHDVLLYKDYVAFTRHTPGVVLTAGGDRQSWTNKRVTFVDPATGKFSVLTTGNMAASSLDWSPEGAHIVCSLGPDAGSIGGGEQAKNALAQRRIWVMDVDGRNQRQLTSDAEYRDEYPQWSHNRRSILFVRMDREDNVSIWMAESTNGKLQKVVEAIADPVFKDLWFSYYGSIPWSNYMAWTR